MGAPIDTPTDEPAAAAEGGEPSSPADGGNAAPPADPPPRSRIGRLRRRLAADAAVWLAAFAVLYAQPYYDGLKNPNERVRVFMTMSMVDRGTYAIDGLSPGTYGWVNDRSVHRDRHFACKAPGTSFLGIPVYAAFRWAAERVGVEPSLRTVSLVLRTTCVVLPFILFLFLLRTYLDERFGRGWVSDVSVLACGLGSLMFPYAHLFAGHLLAGVSLGTAFILIDRADRRRRAGRPHLWGLGLGGLMLGLSPTFEYPAVLAALPVGIWALFRLRFRPIPLLVLAVPAVLAVLPTLHFHYAAFGSPWTTPYPFIDNPYFKRWHETGWVGLTHPRWERLLPILGAPNYGAFFLAPSLLPWWALLPAVPAALPLVVPSFFALPLWAMGLLFLALLVAQWFVWRRAARRFGLDGRDAVTVLVPLLMIAYVSASEMWRGGWVVGPRFLSAAAPFLVLGVARVLHRAGAERRPGLRIAFGGMLLASVAIQVPAGVLYPHIPEEFLAPLPEFLYPLIRFGLAPHSFGSWAGLQGAAFWWPLVVPLAVGLGWLLAVRGVAGWTERIRRGAAVVAVGAVVLAFQVEVSPRSPEHAFGSWALVLVHWEPEGANPALFRKVETQEATDPERLERECRRVAWAGFDPGAPAGDRWGGRPAWNKALACWRRVWELRSAAAAAPAPHAADGGPNR